MVQNTITVKPASYDDKNIAYKSVNATYNFNVPIGQGSDSTQYAQWGLVTGASAETYVFYMFDLSSIPEDAIINSVECSAKGYVSNANNQRVATRQMQMYYGTKTAKGTAVTLTTSATAYNIVCGTWTREELNDCRIRIYCKRGTNTSYISTNYNARFYGANLTITYTYDNSQFFLKTSTGWVGQDAIYQRTVDGWSKIPKNEMETIISPNMKFRNGGHLNAYSLTLEGFSTSERIYINNVPYTGDDELIYINTSTIITVETTALTSGLSVRFYYNGQQVTPTQVVDGRNTIYSYSFEVSDNCNIVLTSTLWKGIYIQMPYIATTSEF